MENWSAQFRNADDEVTDSVFDVNPDVVKALIDALHEQVTVTPPSESRTFDDLVEAIAQSSRLIQHMEAFRELAIAAADRTSPHADRKAIAIAAGFPPSRLYRVLEKHGRPTDRKKVERATEQVAGLTDALNKPIPDRATEQ